MKKRILVKDKKSGFKINEIPVRHYPRIKGTAKFQQKSGMIKPGVIINLIKDMFKLWKEVNKGKK